MNTSADASTNSSADASTNSSADASTNSSIDAISREKITNVVHKLESMMTTFDKFSDSINRFSNIFTEIINKQSSNEQLVNEQNVKCYYANRRWHYNSPIATYKVTRKHYDRRTNIIFEETIYMCSNCLKKESSKNDTIIKSELLK
jgi:hypothetical protein